MAVWSIMSSRELTVDSRIDAEYYTHSGFRLSRKFQKAGVPFNDLFPRVIHPGEFTRGYQETPGRIFLRAQNVRPAFIDITNPIYVSEAVYMSLPNAVACAGDLLLVRTGANHGDLARVPHKLDGVLVSSHTLRLVPSSATPVHALEFFFASPMGRRLLLSLRSGGTHGQINGAALKTLYLPDLSFLEPEAKRIAGIIETKYCEAKDTYAAAEAMLNDALGLADLDLSPSLFYEGRFADASAAGRLDAEYFQPRYKRLLDRLRQGHSFRSIRLAEFCSRPRYGTSENLEYVTTGVPFLRIADLENNRFDLSTVLRIDEEVADSIGEKVQTGDILISRSGTLGVAVPIERNFDGAVFGSYFIKTHPDPKIVHPEYLSLFINSLPGKVQVAQVNTGGIQTNLTIAAIESIQVAIGPIGWQMQFVNKVVASLTARREARNLLDIAKRAVEIAIEDSEASAIKFLNKPGNLLPHDGITKLE